MTGYHHEPVLVPQLIGALAPVDGEIYVDCTVGGGGHTDALLQAARCVVLGLDRDPAALAAASARLAWAGDRFRPVHARFSSLGEVLDHELGAGARVHGILADLGVSSHQLDTAERGFSFQRSGPLDMRMDPTSGNPASVLVNTWDETSLCEMIRELGEERHARRVAQQIVAKRPFEDTAALASSIAEVVPHSGRIHPATRTFQALRIAVNSELDNLKIALKRLPDRLKTGGRLAIISFHSLEDRMVKQAFRDDPRLQVITRKPVVATEEEVAANPRARSAKLRVAERV
jgi:16S rRNA (cytosine1402-N4)-methyltransferase